MDLIAQEQDHLDQLFGDSPERTGSRAPPSIPSSPPRTPNSPERIKGDIPSSGKDWKQSPFVDTIGTEQFPESRRAHNH